NNQISFWNREGEEIGKSFSAARIGEEVFPLYFPGEDRVAFFTPAGTIGLCDLNGNVLWSRRSQRALSERWMPFKVLSVNGETLIAVRDSSGRVVLWNPEGDSHEFSLADFRGPESSAPTTIAAFAIAVKRGDDGKDEVVIA